MEDEHLISTGISLPEGKDADNNDPEDRAVTIMVFYLLDGEDYAPERP